MNSSGDESLIISSVDYLVMGSGGDRLTIKSSKRVIRNIDSNSNLGLVN